MTIQDNCMDCLIQVHTYPKAHCLAVLKAFVLKIDAVRIANFE